MNRIAAGLCLSALLLASPVLAKGKRPNINAAHNAIKNAIRVAAEFSQGQINNRIESELKAAAADKLATRAH